MSTLAVLTIVLFAIGAVQGLVFAVIILLTNRHNLLANRLLSAILFLLSYRLIVEILRLFGLGYYDAWYYIMIDLSWINGALLYFYIKAQITPDFRFRRSDFLHAIPLLIQICASVFVRVQNLYWDGTRESLSWLGYWGYVVWMNYSTIYIIASVLIVCYAIKAQRLLDAPNPDVHIGSDRSTWIRRILMAFRAYFSLVLVVLIADLLIYNIGMNQSYFYFTRFYFYPFFVGLSMLTYWLGLEGYRRKDNLDLSKKQLLTEDKRRQLEQVADRLDDLMLIDHLYTEPELSLSRVAEQLNVKPYLISSAMKEIHQTRFIDYVNRHRIEALRRLIAEPANAACSLLSLALEAGFNSKSSFNRVIQKHLGLSPSELRASVLATHSESAQNV